MSAIAIEIREGQRSGYDLVRGDLEQTKVSAIAEALATAIAKDYNAEENIVALMIFSSLFEELSDTVRNDLSKIAEGSISGDYLRVSKWLEKGLFNKEQLKKALESAESNKASGYSASRLASEVEIILREIEWNVYLEVVPREEVLESHPELGSKAGPLEYLPNSIQKALFVSLHEELGYPDATYFKDFLSEPDMHAAAKNFFLDFLLNIRFEGYPKELISKDPNSLATECIQILTGVTNLSEGSEPEHQLAVKLLCHLVGPTTSEITFKAIISKSTLENSLESGNSIR